MRCVFYLGLALLLLVAYASAADPVLLDADTAVGTTGGDSDLLGTPLPHADVGGPDGFLCVPGQKRRAGETPCIDCPIGTVSRIHDAEACVPCPEGETTLTLGASECVPVEQEQLVQAA